MLLRRSKNQKGVAFIETILTLPVLLLILALTVETSQYIRYNIEASQLAYEGSRLAASRSGLIDNIQSANPTVNGSAESSIIVKLQEIAKRQKMYVVKPNDVSIKYEEVASPQNSITVSVTIPYKKLFNIWGKDHITSSSSVAYLYPET